jgi:hypothetical protein
LGRFRQQVGVVNCRDSLALAQADGGVRFGETSVDVRFGVVGMRLSVVARRSA